MSDPVGKAKRKGVGGVLLGLGLVAGIGGAVLFVIATLDAGKAELLGKAKPLEAGAAEAPPAGELVVVHGKLGAERPARLPGRGEAVIRGKLEIETRYEHWDRQHNRNETKTRTLFEQSVTGEGIYVEGMEGGARIRIDQGAVKGADVDFRGTRDPLHLEEGSGLFAGAKLRYGDIAVEVSDRSDFRSAAAVKSVLEPGAEVWIVGTLLDQAGARTLTAPAGESMSILRESADSKRAELEGRSAWMQPLGAGLAALGALVLLPGLFLLVKG